VNHNFLLCIPLCLYLLFTSGSVFFGDKFEKDEMGEACSAYGQKRHVHKVLVGKTLGRPRRRWEDNIKLDLQEMGCGVMAQDRGS